MQLTTLWPFLYSCKPFGARARDGLLKQSVFLRRFQDRFRSWTSAYFSSRKIHDHFIPLEPRTLMTATVAYSESALSLTGGASACVQADFNNDGKDDLAILTSNSGILSIYLGNGNGTFQSAITTSVSSSAQSLALADFNRDGKLDLAVIGYSGGTTSVHVLLGDADGTFTSGGSQSLSGSPAAFAIGDFNQDGRADVALALTTSGSSTVKMLLGNGRGGFSTGTDISTQNTISAIAVADFNHDGKDDLAIVNSSSDSVAIMLGSGNGTFSNFSTINTDDAPSSIVIADFDHDGNLDLAVSGSTTNTVVIFVGDGQGYFSEKSSISVGSHPAQLAIGDVNGDGNLDILSLNSDGTSVSVLAGNGSGGFTRQLTLSTKASPSALVVGDFNLDGLTDFAVTDSSIASLQLWLNSTSITSHTISAGESYSYTDASGDVVTIKLTGAGTATIIQDSTATRADAVSITLSDTTNKTTLAITVTGSSSKTTSIRLINLGNGKLQSLSAGSVDLTGVGLRGDTGSYIRTIVIHDLLSGADILLPGRIIDGSMSITARIVEDDCRISLGMAVSTATFADFGRSEMITPSIATLKVTGITGSSLYTGNFQGRLILNGIVGSGNYTLSSASIAGSIFRSIWVIAGQVNSISAASISQSNLTITDANISTLAIKGDMRSTTLIAQGIRTWTVGGTMNLVTAELGIVEMDNISTYVLYTLAVTGAMTDCSITADFGSAYSITANSLSDESDADGTTSQICFNNGNINKLTIKGLMSEIRLIANIVTTWTVGGNMASVIATIGSSDNSSVNTLGTLTVSGTIQSSTLTVRYGNVGTISTTSMGSNSKIDVALGTLSTLTIKSNMVDSSLYADRVSTWTIGGYMNTVTAIFDSTTFSTVLGTLTVTGAIEASTIQGTSGSAGTITASTMGSSSKLTFIGGSINKLTVKKSMSQTEITAAKIGTWSVGQDMSSVVAVLGGSSSLTDTTVLSSLAVTGTIYDCIITADYGNAKSISAGAISSESNESSDANTISFASGVISSLTVKGKMTFTTVTARQVGSWTVNNNMDTVAANLGTDAMVGKTVLSSLTVGGSMIDCVLKADYGIASSIKAKNISKSSDETSSSMTFDKILSLNVTSTISETTITADYMGSWTVGGNMETVTAKLGNSDSVSTQYDTTKTIVLAKLVVSGAISDSEIDLQGSAGSISAASMQNTTLNAGLYDNSTFTSYETIGSLTVTSTASSSPFTNNSVFAWQITSLTVIYPSGSTITSNGIGTLKSTVSSSGVATTTTTKNVSATNTVTVSGLTLTWDDN